MFKGSKIKQLIVFSVLHSRCMLKLQWEHITENINNPLIISAYDILCMAVGVLEWLYAWRRRLYLPSTSCGLRHSEKRCHILHFCNGYARLFSKFHERCVGTKSDTEQLGFGGAEKLQDRKRTLQCLHGIDNEQRKTLGVLQSLA